VDGPPPDQGSMENLSRNALGAVLVCCAFSSASAAPSFRVLYHEAIRPETHEASGQIRSISFDAYGRRFSVQLQTNPAVNRAVPRERSDIEPLSGRLEGQAHSWVRLTHTRTGWHGLISDGQDLYAVEPAVEIASALVQPLADASGSASVVYRLKDALVGTGSVYCQILNPDGSPYVGQEPVLPTNNQGEVTAQVLYNTVIRDLPAKGGPTLQLSMGVVADSEFYQQYSDDPEGEIVSRINIVDGIWSSQAGVKISLAPITILKANEPFTKTDPTQLLSQVRKYRGSHSEQMATGVTHLMTGRDLDGDIVGIAYMNSDIVSMRHTTVNPEPAQALRRRSSWRPRSISARSSRPAASSRSVRASRPLNA
jgi:hypothetical protein